MSSESSTAELPRHADLVDQRLVAWYFLAAVAYLTVSMVGGIIATSDTIQNATRSQRDFGTPVIPSGTERSVVESRNLRSTTGDSSTPFGRSE